MNLQIRRATIGCALALCAALAPGTVFAADQGSIEGAVVDALGARVAGASVKLLRDGEPAGETASDARGAFQFTGLAQGRYQVEAAAAGFATRAAEAIFVGASDRVTTEVRLQIGPLEQQLVVTASASALPPAQVGAPVTVIDAAALAIFGNADLLEPIRSVPGAQVVQAGARGGATSLFVRGGSGGFNKILIDGVPANEVGGGFDLADLATTGIDRIEVMRGSNSVLFGSDALTGVVSLTTRRGRTRVPEATVAVDGGNLATRHEDLAIGGAVNRVDYFADYSHLRTDNDLPKNAYRNHTLAGRVGVVLGGRTTLTGTLRVIDTDYHSPNAIAFYGIPDDAGQTRRSTYAAVAAESQVTDRWQSTIRAAVADLDYHFINPTPTGEPFDPFGGGAEYLGNLMTIRAGNGYSATGRAILDFSGVYPSVSDSAFTRRLLHAQTDYHVAPAFDVAGGVRLEHEDGSLRSGSLMETDRNTYGAFVEGRGSIGSRVYATGGAGFDHNTIFGYAATPRLSVAAYLRQPSAGPLLGDTKLTLNAGKGIKAPSLYQELSSVFALIPADTASRLGIAPIGPERSRSLDIGIEQGLAGGRARLRAAYFHNRFTDLIEYVSNTVLPRLGVPAEAAQATGFGAYVNSQSNRARGLELSGEASVRQIKMTGSYMYLDAVVTRSLSGGALSPAMNPAFPGIPIGAYAPLVGARPFRRPANSGSATVAYTNGRAQAALAGYFFGQSDDSTFLSDPFFGDSLLLPNQNFDPAYQKFDVSGSYQVHPRVRWYLTLENAFDEKYEAAAGFPALPRTVRTGVRVTVGGDGTR
jgi:vitamin B12 transporter